MRKTGCSYHVCHISTKESVELVKKARSEGLDVTCETAPHYLTISNNEIEDDGRFKMNPPIKSAEDRQALLDAVRDGTIDMLATDHAPHSAEEKSKGFAGSAFGIVGMETAFPVVYTHLVEKGIIDIDGLMKLMYENPRRRFGLDVRSLYEELASEAPTFTVWNLDEEYSIDPAEFLSMGKSTPFEGWKVKGRCMMTVLDGKKVWER